MIIDDRAPALEPVDTGGTRRWDAAIARALADPALPRVVFQPIIDLRRGVTAGFEVLARFGAPSPAPDRWFFEADRRGVAAEFEARVLRSALAARDRLPPPCFLTANVLPHLLMAPRVAAVWRGADLGRLVLELSEQVRLDAVAGLADVVAQLRDRGGQVALDDVGSAYAGLSRIALVHPDLIKIDRALVAYADHDPVRLALIELVGDFARRIRAGVVAEGIERDEELAVLIALGVPFGQGWLLGRPAGGWQALEPSLADHIRALAGKADHAEVVLGLVERVPILGHDAPAPGPGAAREAILVDRTCRPVALDARRGHGEAARGCRVPVSLVARPDEHVAEIARRAVARPATARFDPVVVVGETGRPLGMVRVERLLLRLAELATGRP